MLIPLGKIPRDDFQASLSAGFSDIPGNIESITSGILDFSDCHPYYTQQLAFVVWEILSQNDKEDDPIAQAIEDLVRIHDMDYERIWNAFNNTDKKLLIGLTISNQTPLSEAFYRKFDLGAPSTVYSSLKRLMQNGTIMRADNKYGIDDPFFKQWIKQRRAQ